MIIDGPNTVDLAVGTDRRLPQEGDAQLLVPPLLMPVLQNLKPHRITFAGTVRHSDSVLRSFFSHNGGGGNVTSTILTLSKGLYELEFSLASVFTADAPSGTDHSASIEAVYLGLPIPVLFRFARVGNYVDYNRMRFLAVDDFTIQNRIQAAAGNDVTMRSVVNAIRVL
jgi:hypothetical protein